MRYIQKLESSAAVQTALDQEELGKPYIAFVEDGRYIDWNSKDLTPTSLPSNTFLFNYNAKRYNSSTGTFTKEEGQLFDEDLVLLNSSLVTLDNNYVTLNGVNTYMTYHWSSATENPFNRTSADCSFTFIYKTSGYTNQGDKKLFSNRQAWSNGQTEYDCHNYLIASDNVYGFEGTMTPNNNPQYIVIRVFNDNSGLRQEVDANGGVIQSAETAFVDWGTPSAGCGFFTGGYNYHCTQETFDSRFYWMYCSNETLTDEEVLQVIKYNDNMG